TYYVRAYAINEAGTSYGSNVAFSTVFIQDVLGETTGTEDARSTLLAEVEGDGELSDVLAEVSGIQYAEKTLLAEVSGVRTLDREIGYRILVRNKNGDFVGEL